MAGLLLLQYGALLILAALCCAEAQRTYYPLRLQQPNVPYLHPASFYPQRHLPIKNARRSSPDDECGSHPGSSCMFVLLCLMGGGTAAAPCSSGVLSTCCVPRYASVDDHTAPPPPPLRWLTTLPPTTRGTEATQRLDMATTEASSLRPSRGNITHCGITKLKPQSRIIGGNDAMYGEFPWQAHIKLNKQQCGGVLLNNYYVLTAAHCIYQVNVKDISVQLGVHDIQDPSRHEHKPQTFQVAEKKVHPRFQYRAAHPDRYDVALLRLSRAARYRDSVQPVCLPRKKDWDLRGKKGVITGWGKTDPAMGNRFGTRLLQKVEVPILSNEQCERWHGEKGIDITISEEMMCAGYEEGKKDACVGDSGGPLMVLVHGRWVVVGLVSAGFGCAQSRQPGIYHRIPYTVDWLRESISS